jgi:hypothetical protein
VLGWIFAIGSWPAPALVTSAQVLPFGLDKGSVLKVACCPVQSVTATPRVVRAVGGSFDRRQHQVLTQENEMKEAVGITEVKADGTLKQIERIKADAYVKTGKTDGRRFVVSIKNKAGKPVLIAVHL